jgi:AcrR family transcriptional regulator
MPRRSAQAVSETRAGVLDVAVRSASIEGFDGLTIGRLADRVAMSKSGLFGLFGSKTGLQLATLRAGIDLFLREVWEPVAHLPAGRERLVALCDRWLSLFERGVLPGGCLITTAAVEFDARPGPVRDAVGEAMDRWLAVLERELAAAVEAGELPRSTDARDAAFHLNALASAASWRYHLTQDREVLAGARRLMDAVLAPGGQPAGGGQVTA